MESSPSKALPSEDAFLRRPLSVRMGQSKETSFNDYAMTTSIKRDISGLNMVAVAFNICNSWTALATTLAIAIAAGGTFTVIYGIIIVGIVYLCVALTLAELASVYPTSGGQYHFASILAPPKLARGLSYVCGIAATASWIFLIAGITILASQLLLSFPAYYIQDYEPQNWHYFLVFQAINIVIHIYNILLLKKTVWIHEVGFVLSLITFVSICITCLARSNKAASSFVWDNFENNVGWPDGITFLTGLVTPAAMFLGLDGAMHLAEEAFNPEKAVPKALVSTGVMGFITGLCFSITMCYCISDLESLVTATMPIFALWRQAIRNSIAATVFLGALFLVTLFAINAVTQTASRMTWAFAADGALAGSKYLSKVHSSLQVPMWSYLANAIVVFVLGCIYLGSTVAFNAVMGSSIILQMISFAIPTLLLVLKKRSVTVLPLDRGFQLPRCLGWTANMVVVCFSVVEVIFFTFPPTNPTSGSGMNYASAVLACTAMFATVNWVYYARKHYQGPKIGL